MKPSMCKGKRLAALLLLGALTLGLWSCAPGESKVTVRVGVALYLQDDTFISTVAQHLERLAKEEELARDIKLNLTMADARGSQVSQNEQVDRFLSQGYDIICVNIVDRTAAAVIIDKAQAAGVPVIFFNREPVEEDLSRWERAYYVGSPAASAGVIQGGIVLDAWQNGEKPLDLNKDGILQYVMLEGEPGHQDALLRTEYSIKALTQRGLEVEKLANASANWERGQGATKMSQWLEEFGFGAIEVVFANNDDMALGAIDACLSAGMSEGELPFIVGVDATPPALEAVAAGTLKGTVLNDAAGQAKAMVKLICFLAGEEDPSQYMALEKGKYAWLDYSRVTSDNLEDFSE